MIRRVALPVPLVLLLGCSGGDQTSAATATATESDTAATGTAATDSTTGGEATRPNWHQDVAPLITRSCLGCHTSGGIAPFSMETYAEAAAWSPLIADDVEAGLMPPWHALETDVCQPALPYEHDPRLAADEIQLLREWADAGAPEGDPALAAPLPDPQSLDLPNPTTTVKMGGTVTVEAAGNTLDYFHCLSLDPGHASDVFVDGLQLIPGNRAIVHHVLIYVDESAASASWPNGIKTNCGGGTGVAAPTSLIAGWVPGGLPMTTPSDVGIALPAGARLILNVHYHATGGGPESDDGTAVALRWSATPPDYVSIFKLLGEPAEATPLTGPLMIPANEKDHVEDYEWTVSYGGQPFPDSIEARIWAVAHHMHKVGIDMRMWVIDRDTKEETCLLHTPRWDFDWQRVYEYDAPVGDAVRVKAGDTIRLRCVYDNSLDNPGVQQVLAEVGLDAPVDVKAGEGTLDEMCIGAIGVAIRGL
ncbi:MAG: hypothetical protein KC420_02180 [Myxococcales bacterium]|nr:hypothetical protein [Myxococcales bacterium]MCB9568255.1 hypothetical protein [Myxococcales bacterium]MCB9704978.1 hypothetical protein [Myxococcales bacterium]